MEWSEVAKTIFYALGSGAALWIARSISKLEESVSELNVKMAVVVERSDGHERRISKLEEKI